MSQIAPRKLNKNTTHLAVACIVDALLVLARPQQKVHTELYVPLSNHISPASVCGGMCLYRRVDRKGREKDSCRPPVSRRRKDLMHAAVPSKAACFLLDQELPGEGRLLANVGKENPGFKKECTLPRLLVVRERADDSVGQRVLLDLAGCTINSLCGGSFAFFLLAVPFAIVNAIYRLLVVGRGDDEWVGKVRFRGPWLYFSGLLTLPI